MMDELDELQRLYKTAYPGLWRRGTPRIGNMPAYIVTDDAQIAEVLIFDQMIATAEEARTVSHATADWMIAVHNAWPQIRDQLTASQAREAGLREALCEFADPDSWWMADAVNIHGNPIKAKAWKFGTEPWTEAQKSLALSAAPPREEEAE